MSLVRWGRGLAAVTVMGSLGMGDLNPDCLSSILALLQHPVTSRGQQFLYQCSFMYIVFTIFESPYCAYYWLYAKQIIFNIQLLTLRTSFHQGYYFFNYLQHCFTSMSKLWNSSHQTDKYLRRFVPEFCL